jgi:hypothetical protein
MSSNALRTRGPQSPMSFTVGTMRLKSRLRNIAICCELIAASIASFTGSPRFSHSSFWLKRSRIW